MKIAWLGILFATPALPAADIIHFTIAIAGFLLAASATWLVIGAWPRRWRAYQRARRRLARGDWVAALERLHGINRQKHFSSRWIERLRKLEGDCLWMGGNSLLATGDFEGALENLNRSAEILNLPQAESIEKVREAVLEEIRRLFAADSTEALSAFEGLTERALRLWPGQPEASFWLGLAQVRRGRLDLALAALRGLVETDEQMVEPSLYLGALLTRDALPSEALGHLSRACRIAPDCPLASWQLGEAALAAKGDADQAEKSLRLALEQLTLIQGNGAYEALNRAESKMPASSGGTIPHVWSKVMPERHSYIRLLVQNHPFKCPVFGNSLAVMIRQVQIALAHSQNRLGRYQGAADYYTAALASGPPTLAVLRGLGRALLGLARYEDAYKHLRAVYEQETPRSAMTAACLAVCAAKGKPVHASDKAKNVEWALTLLAPYNFDGNAEWADLASEVFAEARAAGLELGLEPQLRLCQALAAVDATDCNAAAAYEQLWMTAPHAVAPRHAWLFSRAAQLHGCGERADIALLARTLSERASAAPFFADRGWDFNELEYIYLKRCAARQPGRFPEAFSEPSLGEQLLLDRSAKEEANRNLPGALTAAEVLLRLSPASAVAHDRCARLAYRLGRLEQCCEFLAAWQTLEPTNPTPLIRRAVVEQKRGRMDDAIAAIDQTCQLTTGEQRAEAAFLGARLALSQRHDPRFSYAAAKLKECLLDNRDHQDARWCLAAVYAAREDYDSLAALAPQMSLDARADANFLYLAACCRLQAGDSVGACQAAESAARIAPSLEADCAFLRGRGYLAKNDLTSAVIALQEAADAPGSPSRDNTRAILGEVRFRQNQFAQAIDLWQSMTPARRLSWGYEEPLQVAQFLTGLEALGRAEYRLAADRLLAAERLGHEAARPFRLEALAREAARLIRAATKDPEDPIVDAFSADTPAINTVVEASASNGNTLLEPAIQSLNEVIEAGSMDPHVYLLLSLALCRQKNFAQAREVLDRIPPSSARVHAQQGLISLKQREWSRAETEWARAFELEPHSYPICHNLLLTRLCLGQTESIARLISDTIRLAPNPGLKQIWQAFWELYRESFRATVHDSAQELLAVLDENTEHSLVDLVRSLGHIQTVHRLLQTLALARPASANVKTTYAEAALVEGADLLRRGKAVDAEVLLLPLADTESLKKYLAAAVLNLLGCAVFLTRTPVDAANYFGAAEKKVPDDFRVEQNLALVYEWQGRLIEAETHWQRFFDLAEDVEAGPPEYAGYKDELVWLAVRRLAVLFAGRRQWAAALTYARRANSLRPEDREALEQLFEVCVRADRMGEARRTLQKLRKQNGEEPLLKLFELELVDRRKDGMEQYAAGLCRLLTHHPLDRRLAARASQDIADLAAEAKKTTAQLAGQLGKIRREVRRLPRYQVDWSAVQELMRDLRAGFQAIRRACHKIITVTTEMDSRQAFQELIGQLDLRISQCSEQGE